VTEPDPAELFEDVVEALTAQGARSGRMMGRPKLSIGGRMLACLDDGVLGVRLGAGSAEHTAALALPDSALFSPGRSRRQFRDWVALAPTAGEHWVPYAEAALRRLTA